MKLDRNINSDGMGKYALIKLRNYPARLNAQGRARVDDALSILQDFKMLDFGNVGSESEFMVIKLKDKYARVALVAYSEAALLDDPEYATEIAEMAERSGPASPWCKKPD
jgi:hypothetical protein